MGLNIFAIGDIAGRAGVSMVHEKLRSFKRLKGIDFVVANGENAAGVGILTAQAEDLFNCGVDVITLGNHTFDKKEISTYLDDCEYILRPVNMATNLPGRGFLLYELSGVRILIINLIGRCFMDFRSEDPFSAADRVIKMHPADIVIVDFHAQATSEKEAMGFYLDGRVSAVFGTHTHVQTADERVNPKGTGYISDLGRTGPLWSVLGVKIEQSIAYFQGQLTRFEEADGESMLSGAIFEIDEKNGKCKNVERICIR